MRITAVLRGTFLDISFGTPTSYTYILLELFGASVGTDKDHLESAFGLLGGVVKINENRSKSLAGWTPGSREIQSNHAGFVGFQSILRGWDCGALYFL